MKPIVVLGVGNLLLRDDAVGLRMLDDLSGEFCEADDIDFVDGGTQGLALLPQLGEHECVLILDAVRLGDAPGTVHQLGEDDLRLLPSRHADTSHEGNCLELIAMARLLGESWQRLVVLGVEPSEVKTGLGLSAAAEGGAAQALIAARQLLGEMRSLCV